MKPTSIQQIRQAIGGRALTPIPASVPPITAVCTDTRRMDPFSLFVALKGDNFNGHAFLRQAAAGGAIAAVVDEVPEISLPNVHLIHVPDARKALGKLATFVRKTLLSKVIAVAGSNGKTSTKQLIDAALRGQKRGSISPKSFNNDIGVPLAIFPADPNQDYLVLEMGTNHHGEIKVLTSMALPDVAVITNVGAEHLEGLDDLMGVRREEASIITGLNRKGLLVVNGDDQELLDAVSPYPGKRVTFGLKESNDLFATDIRCDENGVRFRLNKRQKDVFVPLLGRHTASNALAAIAVARWMGLSEAEVIDSLAHAHGADMRLQLVQTAGVTILNDAYNANPNSMRAAIETLCALQSRGRRIAIVGDMRELGQATDRYHREMGEFAATQELDMLVCVGAKSALIAEAARGGKMSKESVVHFPDATAASKGVLKLLRDDDLVLLKASRSIHLESIAQAIAEGRRKFFRKVAG